MNISKICGNQFTYSLPTKKLSEKSNLDYSLSQTSNLPAESKQNNSVNIWNDLSQKYDIKNATYEEIDDISLKLYNSGEISLMQRALLTDDMSKIPQPFVQQSLKNNGYLTQINSSGGRNWIEEFKLKANQQIKFGNMKGYTDYQNIAEILNKINKK